ncbi:amidase family protein [Burkholderia cepacia]|uniref:amidase family protein n=1 Tax=Burkholderia cepacia TaxID=292 RepID=UPI00298FF3B1|nr:amidase family protein [Burkholderia cepacia]MDW9227686.1 amidase family protein [Burkholderia cepacia]
MSSASPLDANVDAIARAVRTGHLSAESLARAALDRIVECDARIHAIQMTFETRALADARRIDETVRAGRNPGPLAGVPFLVKCNFDVAGYTTVAGSPARLALPAASADAALVARLCAAGAVPVGATHMDELACGATGVNPHFGAVHLPADSARMTGGSSSGSAAAVAAGYTPLALGSDTNGSIRAPAALCGVWAVKPSNGGLEMQGCLPYAPSLDVAGGFARTFADLVALYDALCGTDRSARVGNMRAPLRVAALTGGFMEFANADARRAVQRAAACFGHVDETAIDEDTLTEIRAASLTVSNYELARAHRILLDAEPSLVSARLRERIVTGLATADSAYEEALSIRVKWRARLSALFSPYEVLIAPATPYAAPLFTDTAIEVNGTPLEPAKSLGRLTQPISFAALPVVSAPCHAGNELPVGVQLIGAKGSEAACFAAGAQIARARGET